MNDYRNFSAEQFTQDDYFKKWVIAPTPEANAFWNDWMTLHPEKRALIATAKAQVIALEEFFGDSLTTSEIEEEIELLKLKASLRTKRDRFSLSLHYKIAAAACLLLLGTASYFYLHFNHSSSQQLGTNTSIQADWIERSNQLHTPQTIILSDGSEVILGQNSSIRYLSNYEEAPNRIVHLSGEAFFEIAKDSLQPFLVYAGNTVTRVLGTSFRVNSNDQSVEVRVATGKVSVHRLEDFESHANYHNHPNIPGVILSPKDKAVFEATHETFSTSRLRKDEAIVIPRVEVETEYTDVQVADLLQSLSETYQVKIDYDAEALQYCSINTMFKDESLLQKVKLICLAIGTDYHIDQDVIVIHSTTCK